MPLDKGGRRRTYAYNQVKPLFGIEGAKVFDKRVFRIVTTEAGSYERVFREVQRPQ